MRLLDLFCCAGGASRGYELAGFDDILGVDLYPQPHYPYAFLQADVLVLNQLVDLASFDLIHASPPCQGYSETQRIRNNKHPMLIDPVRAILRASGKPYIIENVVGAPLLNPILLCGTMFGIRTYRHRLFECSFPIRTPDHPAHQARQAKMGRPVQDGEFMHVVGNMHSPHIAREIMGTPWMNRQEMAQALPVCYTEYIGKEWLR